MKPDVVIADTLIIEVIDEGEDGTWLRKPEAANDERYWIVQPFCGEPIVYISETNRFPLYLQFEANVPIEAVGFAKHGECVHRHSGEGPCGGCFSLVTGFSGVTETTTPLILNAGDDLEDGYDFSLYFPNGRKFDPRIYNHGRPQVSWWKRLRQFLRRLYRLLKIWLLQ